MVSGLPLAGVDGVPSETAPAEDDELAAGVLEPAVLELLLLQAAAVRARTLSPAAAITRFMTRNRQPPSRRPGALTPKMSAANKAPSLVASHRRPWLETDTRWVQPPIS